MDDVAPAPTSAVQDAVAEVRRLRDPGHEEPYLSVRRWSEQALQALARLHDARRAAKGLPPLHELELSLQRLPASDAWKAAVDRASAEYDLGALWPELLKSRVSEEEVRDLVIAPLDRSGVDTHRLHREFFAGAFSVSRLRFSSTPRRAMDIIEELSTVGADDSVLAMAALQMQVLAAHRYVRHPLLKALEQDDIDIPDAGVAPFWRTRLYGQAQRSAAVGPSGRPLPGRAGLGSILAIPGVVECWAFEERARDDISRILERIPSAHPKRFRDLLGMAIFLRAGPAGVTKQEAAAKGAPSMERLRSKTFELLVKDRLDDALDTLEVIGQIYPMSLNMSGQELATLDPQVMRRRLERGLGLLGLERAAWRDRLLNAAWKRISEARQRAGLGEIDLHPEAALAEAAGDEQPERPGAEGNEAVAEVPHESSVDGGPTDASFEDPGDAPPPASLSEEGLPAAAAPTGSRSDEDRVPAMEVPLAVASTVDPSVDDRAELFAAVDAVPGAQLGAGAQSDQAGVEITGSERPGAGLAPDGIVPRGEEVVEDLASMAVVVASDPPSAEEGLGDDEPDRLRSGVAEDAGSRVEPVLEAASVAADELDAGPPSAGPAPSAPIALPSAPGHAKRRSQRRLVVASSTWTPQDPALAPGCERRSFFDRSGLVVLEGHVRREGSPPVTLAELRRSGATRVVLQPGSDGSYVIDLAGDACYGTYYDRGVPSPAVSVDASSEVRGGAWHLRRSGDGRPVRVEERAAETVVLGAVRRGWSTLPVHDAVEEFERRGGAAETLCALGTGSYRADATVAPGAPMVFVTAGKPFLGTVSDVQALGAGGCTLGQHPLSPNLLMFRAGPAEVCLLSPGAAGPSGTWNLQRVASGGRGQLELSPHSALCPDGLVLVPVSGDRPFIVPEVHQVVEVWRSAEWSQLPRDLPVSCILSKVAAGVGPEVLRAATSSQGLRSDRPGRSPSASAPSFNW